MGRLGQSLARIVTQTDYMNPVFKSELRFGDLLQISTHNSLYSIRVLDHGFYQVSGGWFDANAVSPFKTTISGCTWGGSIINVRIVAACGLCLEFGNRVVTSPITSLKLIKAHDRGFFN